MKFTVFICLKLTIHFCKINFYTFTTSVQLQVFHEVFQRKDPLNMDVLIPELFNKAV
jgi:hypothetical protein